MKFLIRFVVCTLVMVSLFRLDAASVSWDAHRLDWFWGGSGGNLFTWNGAIPLLSQTKTGSAIVLWADMNVSHNLTYRSAVVVASYGDTISADYFNSQTEFFYDDLYYDSHGGDPLARTDYPLVVNEGESVFIAMRKTVYDQAEFYGWAEIFIDDNGEVAIATSATDIDGDPITIKYRDEGVPEPSSALLLLVGGALLSLRRTHGFRDCAPTRRFHSCLRDMTR